MVETNLSDHVKPRRTLMGLLKRWFFAGLLVSAPILLTVYITWLFINIVDGYVASLLPSYLQPSTYVNYDIPGFGIVIGGITIIFIGGLTAGLLGRTLIRLGESIVGRLPIVRSVYGATKQIMETVMASQSDAFREVVLIEYPRRGIWAVGFVTGTTKGEIQNMSSETLINIFVPTTPNPTSGFLLFVPRGDAIALDMGVEDAVKMVVSGGIVTPADAKPNRKPMSLKSPVKPAKKSVKKAVSKKAVTKKSATKKAATKKPATKKAATKKAAKKSAKKSG